MDTGLVWCAIHASTVPFTAVQTRWEGGEGSFELAYMYEVPLLLQKHRPLFLMENEDPGKQISLIISTASQQALCPYGVLLTVLALVIWHG